MVKEMIEVLDTQTPQELPASHTTGYQLQNFEAMDQPSGTLEKGNKDVVYQLEPSIKQNLNSNLNFVCQVGISPIKIFIQLWLVVKVQLVGPIKNNNDNVSKETGSRGTTRFPQEIVKIHDTPVEAPNQDVSVVNSSNADQVQPSSCYQDKDASQQHLIHVSSNPETSSDECDQDQCHKECQGFKNTIKANRERKLKDKEKVSSKSNTTVKSKKAEKTKSKNGVRNKDLRDDVVVAD
ncbi:hypothetical protein Tco_0847784 [Tanacetum coccineum]